MEETISQIKPLLLQIGLAAVAVGVVLMAGRHLMQWYYRRHARAHPRQAGEAKVKEAEEQDGAIPLLDAAPAAATRSHIKKWKVSGVEKANGNDATWYIDAESRANAKVKAELKGMIVTAVERAPGEM